MVDERVGHLIEKLIDLSEAGRLAWEPAVQDNAYQTKLSKGTIVVYQRPTVHGDVDDEVDNVFELYDKSGDLVESFDDVELRDTGYLPYGDVGWYAKTTKLFQKARASALGVDRLIDDLLSELSEKRL